MGLLDSLCKDCSAFFCALGKVATALEEGGIANSSINETETEGSLTSK